MVRNKKLQVFISSTYTDLQKERQAAVEAILTTGHIPAGMELFAAGDESQMNVIKHWIDESDIYMLILGGRYGTLEPKRKKSYIHLEYQYALECGKPLFAVVITEEYLEKKVMLGGSKVIETENPGKLREFRQFVCSKMVRFWNDPKDIKLAIMETMADFSKRPDLVGWVRESEVIDSASIAEELARLAKENSVLREQLANTAVIKYSGLSYQEMYEQLIKEKLAFDEMPFLKEDIIKEILKIFRSDELTILHFFWSLSGKLLMPKGVIGKSKTMKTLRKLAQFGLVGEDQKSGSLSYFKITETGRDFFLRLRTTPGLTEAEQYILL